MGDLSRGVAFHPIVILIVGTFIGSVCPEPWNLLASRLGFFSHGFNMVFAIVGILGAGLALYLGYKAGGSYS